MCEYQGRLFSKPLVKDNLERLASERDKSVRYLEWLLRRKDEGWRQVTNQTRQS